MSNDRPYHKPKWQEPEITDFTEQMEQPKCCCQQTCGMPLYPSASAARRLGSPNPVWLLNPYCRPNGFNYGYGAWPRR